MKKSVTLVLSFSVIYWSNAPLLAQGKGSGRGTPPSVSQGRHAGSEGPKTNSGKEAKPPSTGQQPKTTWETKFNQRLQSDPKLQTRIQGLLPAGTDPQAAASGFKNHGQFIAALHVSRNLGIPFDQLKAKMTGIAPASTTSGQTDSTSTTTSSPMSLGKAIQELKPAMTESQTTEAVKRAEKQAKETEKVGTQT